MCGLSQRYAIIWQTVTAQSARKKYFPTMAVAVSLGPAISRKSYDTYRK